MPEAQNRSISRGLLFLYIFSVLFALTLVEDFVGVGMCNFVKIYKYYSDLAKNDNFS